MESVFRAAFMYFFLLLVVRLSGNRTLNEMTMFDFVLLLIMGDASQQAITGNDYSVMNGVIVILTLVLMDVFISIFKQKYQFIDRLIDGCPLILISDGKLQRKVMSKVKIDETDILEAARKNLGLERLEQIKYAILEKDGDITIIKKVC